MNFFGKWPTFGRSLELSMTISASLFLLQLIEAQSVMPTDSFLLKEIIIRAERVGEGSPVPHTNLSKKEIEANNQGLDIPYLLKKIPGLVETSDAGTGIGYTSMRIRGSDQTRINVTINGIPLNDAESQQVFWVDLPDFAASTDEIQVQRGIGSSTNGAGAFGATVNLSTNRVQAEPTAILSNSVGSFGTFKHSIGLSTGLLKNGFSFDGRLSKISSDGFVDRAFSKMNAWFLGGAWVGERASVRANVFSGHEKTYQSWYGLPAQYIDNEALRTFNAAGTERPGSPYKNQVDDYGQRHWQVLLNAQLAENWRLNVNFHGTNGSGFYEEYKAGQTLAEYSLLPFQAGDSTVILSDLVRQKWLDNQFLGTTWALRFQKNKLETTFGGGLNEYRGRHFGEVIWAEIFQKAADAGPFYYENKAHKTDLNFFWKTEKSFVHNRLNDRPIRVFADLQWRTIDYQFTGFDADGLPADQTVFYHFINPKTGFSIQLAKNQSIYGFVGIGNHEPNRTDFTESSPASRPKSERLIDWETGWRFNENHNSRLSVNLFFMDYFNQLAQTGRLNDVGAATRVNVPRSHRAGLEIESNWTFLKNGNWSMAACFSRNKIRRFEEFVDDWDTGEQTKIAHTHTDLSFSPNLVLSSEASWQFLQTPENQRLGFIFSGKHVGRQFLDNTSNGLRQLAAYTSFDARLRFVSTKILGRELALLFSLNNVFDARFSSNGWTYHFQSTGYDPTPDDPYSRAEGNDFYNLTGLFPQAGRHFLATLNFKL